MKKKMKRMQMGGATDPRFQMAAKLRARMGAGMNRGAEMPQRGFKMGANLARPAMKGGGLARKGVGQALKAGGMVKACGVAKRGKTKGKMV